MASYSDFIQMQNYLPVYDITAESSNRLWASFIPTNQFCDLLQQTMTAVSSSDKFKRKSIWVQGTFGTGKSHASSVVRHLLCDKYEDVNFYFNKIEDPSLRAQIDNFRRNKRFFSVAIKGVEGAYDLPRFSLSLQRQVKEALNAAGHSDIVVKSDFESAVQYVEDHMQYTQDAIDKNEDLKDIAPNPKTVISLLKGNNIQAYMELEEALYKTVGVPLTTKNVSEWLAEVEHAIEAEGIADGLIIFWDEFTSIMEAIGSDRINVLQNIAEKSQSCNLFLFLISHRVEDQVTSSKRDDVKTMNDRFYTIRYMMDEVSTYKVMRHTFDIQGDDDYAQLRYNRTVKLNELIDYLCEGGVEDERKSILELFPMHPYSAFLCSKLSDYVGSANRSVVNFMNDDKKGFRKFITDESVYDLHGLLTAEWLWDFFFDSFAANPLCGAFISNYQNHIYRVQEAGDDYVRVYKGILLLNTLSTQFATKSTDIIARISPNEKSIRGLFADDRLESKMDDILRFLDTNQIIARDVFGEFKISVSSLNPAEIAKEKEKVAAQFKTANDFLGYNFASKTNITKLFTVGEYLIRKCEPQLFSCSDQESVIRAKLNKYTSEKPNTLHVVIYLAVTEEERRGFENRVKDFSSEFLNSIHIIPDEVFSSEARTKFIDLIANHNVAKSHYQESIEKESELAAQQLINKWSNRLVNGAFSLYFNGEQTREGIIGNIYTLINKKFSFRVFSKGMESIKAYRNGITNSFLANKNFPALVLQMLQSPNRDKLVKFTGSDNNPAKYIFEENDNFLVDDECKLTPAAIASEAWIAQVCQEVDQCIEDAKKKYVDKFSLSEIFAPLMRPPFGFFPSRANWVAFAYALRKHKADLFVTTISQPISDEKLEEMIVELFKMWNEGHSEASNKLMLRFGSKEESELTQLLYDVFQLQFIKDISEVKSLSNVRWGINEFCMQKSKYPLWVLTYCDNINETRSSIIKLLIEVLEADQNPDIAKIKSLYRLINSERIDITQLVSNTNNYENGFLNFINSLKNVKIQRDWWNDLIDEISHLQSEVAFRKESDVRECVLNFYIGKVDAQKPTPPASPSTAETTSFTASTSTSATPVVPNALKQNNKPLNAEAVKKAKNLIKEANMPGILWQKFVLDIIEANPEVAEFITNYLS